MALGNLHVNVTAGTAEFQRDMDKLTDTVNKFGEGGKTAGRAMSGGMHEGQMAIRLLGHELGVPIPRELARLAAQIPMVGAAFAAMLPVVGIVAAVAMIGKLIEKHEEAAAAIRKHAVDMQGLTAKENEASNSIDLANLKLDDQIAKLTGGMTTNHFKEALLESANAADKMAQTLAEDFTKVDTNVEKSTGFFGRLKSSALDFYDLLGGGLEGYKKALDQAVNSDSRMVAGKEKLAQAQKAVNAANLMADDTADQQIEKQKALGVALQARADAETHIIKIAGNNNQELVQQLDQAAEQDKRRAADTAKEIIRIGKEAELAAEQDAHDLDEHQAKSLRQRISYTDNTEKAAEEKRNKAIKDETDAVSVSVTQQLEFVDKGTAARTQIIQSAMTRLKHDHLEWTEEYKHLESELTDNEKSEAEKRISAIERETKAAHERAEADKESLRAQHEISKIDIKSDVASGVTSKLNEQAELKKIYQLEHDDLIAADAKDVAEAKKKIDELNALAVSKAPGVTDEKRAKALEDSVAAQTAMSIATSKTAVALKQLEAQEKACDTETKRLNGNFHQWIADMKKDLPTTAKLLETSMDKAFDGMNSAMAKSLVEGKNFGKAMRQVGEQLLESVIEQELKKVEVYLLSMIHRKAIDTGGDAAKIAQATATAAIMKTLAASEAAAWAFESAMQAVPFPGNMTAAPIAAATALAQALAFEHGGLVPGSGGGDTVPAMLSPGETVVTKALTERVTAAEHGGSQSGHVIQHSPTYHISMIDSTGVAAMLKKHDDQFQKHAVSTMRKMNTRVGRG